MANEILLQAGQHPPNHAGPSRPDHPTNRQQQIHTAADSDKEVAVAQPHIYKVAIIDRRWKLKTALRAAILVADVVAVACVALVIDPRRPTNQMSSSFILYFSFDTSGLTYSLFPLGVSILWCTFVSSMLFLRRPPRALHPGIAAGFELVFFVLFLVAVIISCIGIIHVADYFDSMGSFLHDSFSTDDDIDIWQDAIRRRKLQIVIVTIQVLAMLLHLFLLYWACSEMAGRNKQKVPGFSRDMQEKLRSYGPADKGKQPAVAEMLADVRQPAELAQPSPANGARAC